MTNTEPTVFHTAKDAEKWLIANPMRVLLDNSEDKWRFNPKKDRLELFDTTDDDWIFSGDLHDTYSPYTVIPAKTITINGKQYRVGDRLPTGCKDSDYYRSGVVLKSWLENHILQKEILHIPDELADKPKEPKTLTEAQIKEAINDKLYFVNPLNDSVDTMRHWADKAAAIVLGLSLYATEADAKLGKARGWK